LSARSARRARAARRAPARGDIPVADSRPPQRLVSIRDSTATSQPAARRVSETGLRGPRAHAARTLHAAVDARRGVDALESIHRFHRFTPILSAWSHAA